MKKKELLLLILLLLCAWSCDRADTRDAGDRKVSPPAQLVKSGNHALQVTVSPVYFSIIEVGPIPLEPDYYSLYRADSFEGMGVEIDQRQYMRDTITYTLTDVTNGNPYYLYVVGIKKGYPAVHSGRIMGVPGEEVNYRTLFEFPDGKRLESIDVSPHLNKIVSQIRVSGEGTFLHFCDLNGENEEYLEWFGYKPGWAYSKSWLAMSDRRKEGYKQEPPSHLFLYDYENKEYVQLTEGDKWYYHPVFSPDDRSLLFWMAADETKDAEIKLGILDLETKEEKIIADISPDLYDISNLGWIDTENFCFEVYEEESGKRVIYKGNVNEKKIARLLEQDPFDQFFSSFSPDGKQVLFCSNRSGHPELWVYNLGTRSYRQLSVDFEVRINNNAFYAGWLDNKTIYCIPDGIRGVEINL
ncbi:MAG: hypothetical protein LUG98_03440 [Tannerellaceae bacterium]|nr:hypothetical protein [Tannerellaceae bacterium]